MEARRESANTHRIPPTLSRQVNEMVFILPCSAYTSIMTTTTSLQLSRSLSLDCGKRRSVQLQKTPTRRVRMAKEGKSHGGRIEEEEEAGG